ncbi:hypothetical protein TSAR_004571 [Trichomalopsis sarcophagae]|uniref:Uncharacterized protein n=1 Tax=Trichomalopsis sarcophagae TaxID=543379 RepID=A0A232F5K3_9HYME|nr:hypothetical protein TSAR_004571 [Trichomalopsis sarcophagae]
MFRGEKWIHFSLQNFILIFNFYVYCTRLKMYNYLSHYQEQKRTFYALVGKNKMWNMG